MCIGLVIDTMVIMVLAKFLSGHDSEDWVKPLIVAILASAGSAAALTGMESIDMNIYLFLGGALFAIAALVTVGCWLLMNVEFGKSALIGLCFLGYKLLFVGVLIGIGMVGSQ